MAKPELSIKDCEVIIGRYLDTEAAAVSDFSLKRDSGENFELTVNTETKNFTFFVKTSSDRPQIYEILANIAEVIPQFGTSLIPKLCYIKTNFLVFEDLKSQGFKNSDGMLNCDHLVLMLQTLAKLHAASVAFEEAKSKTQKFRLDREYALLHLNFNLKTPEVSNLLSALLEDGDVSKITEELEERQFSSRFRKSLCHGNLTAKNIMFKYNKETPEDCKLLNTKSNFYAPPVYDVLQAIFFNTTEDLRRQHLHTLLLQYFDFLTEELNKYNLYIINIIPIDDFLLGAHHFLPLIKLEATLLDKEKSENLLSLKETLTCPLLSREDCYVIIKNKFGTTDYEFLSFQVTPLSDVSGFLGEYNRLQIKIRLFSEVTSINCFIKASPRTGISQIIAKELESFPREVFVYYILAPEMNKYGINMDECLPPCYFHRPEEFMVFEDMELLEYKNLDALEPLDFDCLNILMRKLARFHSCSIILEEKISEESHKPYSLLDAYKEYFNEPLFFEHETHLGARQFMVGIKAVPDAVELISEIQTDSNRKNFKRFWPQFKELFYTVIKTSGRFRNVLNHGDLWTSNTLIRFEDQKPTDCVLIDFQIVRYCPPAYDILSALHRTTDRPTRLKYEDQLLQIYYEELAQSLQSHGYSIEKIYPYEDLVGCVEYMRPQMLMQAAIECTLTMCTPEEISSFLIDDETCSRVFFEDRTEFMTAMCQKSDKYRTRLKECVLDIYDYCDSVCSE